jgi:hypothetical protein
MFKRQEEITEKQLGIYQHIVRWVADYGYQPTVSEMADYFGLKSRRSVIDRLHQLASKGYVGLPERYQERCIRLTGVGFKATFEDVETPEVLREEDCALYEYIARFVCEHGFQPSTIEAGEHFGKNRTAISAWLRRLEACGLLTMGEKYQERRVRLNGVRFTPVVRHDR